MTDPINRNIDVTSDDRMWALLSYILLPLVGAIVLLMEDKKNRPFLRFHAVQSVALGIALWVVVVVLGIIPVVNCISPLVALAGWIYAIYLGLQANKGDTFDIPTLTDFLRKQNWI